MTGPPELSEAITRLEEMPAFLDAAMAAAGARGLRHAPGDGGFSLGEHACHLRDLEREGFLVRVRRLIAEQAPRLAPFDGDAVAAAHNYPAQDAGIAAQEFAAARRELTGLLAALTRDEMARPAFFGDRPVTFGEVVAMMVAHDREHRDDIGRLLQLLQAKAGTEWK